MTYSLQFTERMTGAFAFAEADYRAGYELGRKTGNRLLFRLTIATDDVDQFLADREHPAAATGYVGCDPLGGRLPVQQGAFDLFVDEGPATRHMLYRLYFADATGLPLTLAGFKDVRPGPADRRMAGDLHPLLPDPGRPCPGHRRRVGHHRGAGGFRDPADPPARLRLAADDVPGARPGPERPDPGARRLRAAFPERAVAGLRTRAASTARNRQEGRRHD